jgi:hypothetical protein
MTFAAITTTSWPTQLSKHTVGGQTRTGGPEFAIALWTGFRRWTSEYPLVGTFIDGVMLDSA